MLAGRVEVERERVTAQLDAPYAGFPTATVRRLASIPNSVMSIENLTTFHSEAKRRCNEPVLLLYTAGMPSPAWRAMYVRLLTALPADVSVYHWGDLDEGGFRIAAVLGLRERLLHATSFARGECIRRTFRRVSDAKRHRELLSECSISLRSQNSNSADAIGEAGFTIEQEAL